MRSKFSGASQGLILFNLKSKLEPESGFLVKAKELFAEKYPELSDPKDIDHYETFENQLDKSGFIYGLMDSYRQEIRGLAAGVVYKESKSASLTYVVTQPGDDEALAVLTRKTLGELKSHRKVEAIYGELYKPGHEEDVARDSAERTLYAKMGAEDVPVTGYEQPRYADDDFHIPGLKLVALFTKPGMTGEDKSERTKAHMDAYTRLYDPELENPINQKLLASYEPELAPARWMAKPQDNAPKNDF